MPRSSIRTEKLDLRLTPAAKRVLQRAAAASHKTVSEFVLSSALAAAEENIRPFERIGLNAEQWETIQQILDAPPRSTPGLAKLLADPSVLERE